MARKKTAESLPEQSAVPGTEAERTEVFAGANLLELKRFIKEEPTLKAKKDTAATDYARLHKEFKDKVSDAEGVKMGLRLCRMEVATRNVRLQAMLEFMVAFEKVGTSQDDMFDNDSVATVLRSVLAKVDGTDLADTQTAADAQHWPGSGEPLDTVEDMIDEPGEAGEHVTRENSDGDDEAEGPAVDVGEQIAQADDPDLEQGGVFHSEGHEAGMQGKEWGANPYDSTKRPVAHDLWEQGRQEGQAARDALQQSIAGDDAETAEAVDAGDDATASDDTEEQDEAQPARAETYSVLDADGIEVNECQFASQAAGRLSAMVRSATAYDEVCALERRNAAWVATIADDMQAEIADVIETAKAKLGDVRSGAGIRAADDFPPPPAGNVTHLHTAGARG